MKPVIGITPNYNYNEKTYSINSDYVSTIQISGGIPIILTPNTEFPNFIDGLLLSGGGDIDPLLFDEEPIIQNGLISPIRDEFEIKICKKAIKNNLPLLGICRGMQIINIALGGKIYQDICLQTKSNLKHSGEAPRFYPTHTIDIVSDSLLNKIIKQDIISVNSFHHQAISEIGKDLEINAVAKDGIIEAISHKKNKFLLGLQWHPEAMKTKEQGLIFEFFINSCK